MLDVYAGRWQGTPLGPKASIRSAEEKTSSQARRRCPPRLPPAPGRVRRSEQEDARGGAVQYWAAGEVRRGLVLGRGEPSPGRAPFGHLVAPGMEQEPDGAAERVCWVVATGSSQRGAAATHRLTKAYAHVILVPTPVPASWLKQGAIYFSLVHRKGLPPNDFASLTAVAQRLPLYEALSNRPPHPFAWKFTRAKLLEFLERLHAHEALRTPGDPIPAPPGSDQHELLAA